ncbi:MAG: PTS sugar transporter subunit IIA, partial [Phycisphaerae bacterium]|nr:PTS sugar transporter subunit IIA [Phycisphaerae bacterium]
MKLSEIFSQDAFIPQLRSDTRDGAIQELLEVLLGADQLSSQDYRQILQALIEREANGSTGFGKGVSV